MNLAESPGIPSMPRSGILLCRISSLCLDGERARWCHPLPGQPGNSGGPSHPHGLCPRTWHAASQFLWIHHRHQQTVKKNREEEPPETGKHVRKMILPTKHRSLQQRSGHNPSQRLVIERSICSLCKPRKDGPRAQADLCTAVSTTPAPEGGGRAQTPHRSGSTPPGALWPSSPESGQDKTNSKRIFPSRHWKILTISRHKVLGKDVGNTLGCSLFARTSLSALFKGKLADCLTCTSQQFWFWEQQQVIYYLH